MPVSDFDAAAAWYHEIFGFETVFSDPLSAGIYAALYRAHNGINEPHPMR